MSYQKEINDLGTFNSLSQLWNTHPEGGKEGDWCTVAGTKYYWNPYNNNWESQYADTSYSPAYKNHIVDGDLNVRHDVTIAGTLRVHGLKSHECGLFATSTDLRSTHPKPEAGDWAIVGPSDGYYYVYLCEQDGTWIKGPATSIAGGGGGGSSADLSALIARITQAESGISANAYAITQAANAASAAQQSANAAQASATQAAASAASAVFSAQQAADTAASAQQTAQDAASNASNAVGTSSSAYNGVLQVMGTLQGKADLDSNGTVTASAMPRVMLAAIETPDVTKSGDIWYNDGWLWTDTGSAIVHYSRPRQEAIYCVKATGALYRWDGSKMSPVGGSGGGSIHIDDNPEPGSGSAVSSGGVYSALQSRDITINSLQQVANDYQANGLKTSDINSKVAGLNAHESIPLSAMPPVVLDKIGFNHNSSQTWTGTYQCTDGYIRKARYNENSERVVTEEWPSEDAIYYDKDTDALYHFNGLIMMQISEPGGGTPQVTGVGDVIRVEEQDGWSDNFVNPAKQAFTVPVITDYIYFVSNTAINWENDSTKRNPSTWVSDDFDNNHKTVRPYAIANDQSGWLPLKSRNVNVPSGRLVYVSHRDRVLSSEKYSAYSVPVLISSIDSDVLNSIKDNTTWNVSKELRDNFTQTHSVNLANARATREFLQGIIDDAREDQVIVFPKDKTFVIDFDPSGYYDGQANMRMNYDPYEIARMYTYYGTGEPPAEIPTTSYWVFQTLGANPEYYSKVVFVGLNITHKVRIDLNGSTIKFAPNWLPNFKTVYIGTHLMNEYLSPTGLVTTDPSGTVIENGSIDGGREWTMYFPIHARTYLVVDVDENNQKFVLSNFENTNYENDHAISASRKVELRHLDVGNAAGDGICISSHFKWGGDITCSSRGKIDETGQISSSQDGDWYSDLVDISTYSNATMMRCDIVARPAHSNAKKYYAKVDLGPFFISEYVTVAYYSGNTYKSQEHIQFGDTLNVPDGCDKFRFFINIDKSRNNATNEDDRVGVMLCSVIWSYGTLVEDCDIHDCGRDGFTLACMKNSVIRNCRISRCDQCQIDIEGTAYLDNDLYVEGLIIDPLEDNGIKSVTGDHFMMTRSKVNGVMSAEPYVHISDSDLQWLKLGTESGSTTEGTFNSNISKPRRVVRDCIIRGDVTAATNTLFENCIFGGNFSVYDRNPRNGKYPNTFNHCTFKVAKKDDVGDRGLSPGIYTDCTIISEGPLNLQMYYASSPENSEYVFRRCKITAESVYTVNGKGGYDDVNDTGEYLDATGALLDIDDCVINLSSHFNLYNYNVFTDLRPMQINRANFAGAFIRRLTNSVINFAQNSENYFEFMLSPYAGARIEGNVFNPTGSSSNSVQLLKLYLRAIDENGAYHVSVKRNVVNYYGESAFLFIHPLSSEDDITVCVEDNVFVNKSSSSMHIKDVVFVWRLNDYESSGTYQHQDYVTLAQTPENVKARLLGNRAVNGEVTQATGDNVIRQ